MSVVTRAAYIPQHFRKADRPVDADQTLRIIFIEADLRRPRFIMICPSHRLAERNLQAVRRGVRQIPVAA